MTLAKARIINYNRNCSFIVLATVITTVNYDRHLFIVQATGALTFVCKILMLRHISSVSAKFKLIFEKLMLAFSN